MTPKPPLLDSRGFEDILALLRDSASRYMPEWAPGDKTDPGVMLQHTFARLMEIAVERLNRVPEKLMLAFLESMNISPLPPLPARAPLVFAPKAGALPVLVPRGTVVSAKTPGGQSPVFETTEDLTVLPAAITSAYTLEPGRARYGDYTESLSGGGNAESLSGGGNAKSLSDGGFTPFIGDRDMPGAWYFVVDKPLNIDEPAKTELLIRLNGVIDGGLAWDLFVGEKLIKKWSCSTADGECLFDPGDDNDHDRFLGNMDQFTLSLSDCEKNALSPQVVNSLGGGCEPPAGCYVKAAAANSAELANGLGGVAVDSARLSMESCPRPPDRLYNRNARLDPEGYILPFGKRPRAGDTFFIDFGDLPEQDGDMSVVVKLVPDVYKGEFSKVGRVGEELNWEDMEWSYSATGGWERTYSSKTETTVNPATGPAAPESYTYSMTFGLPRPIKRKVGGEEGFWLRATLPTDDCGVDAEYALIGGAYSLVQGTGKFIYPKVRSIAVAIQYSTECRVYKRTGHVYTQYGAQGGPIAVSDVHQVLDGNAFYLGFDRLIPQAPVSLYADVAPTASYTWSLEDKPPAWECLTDRGWRQIYAVDDTDGFDRSGAIRFLAPQDALYTKLFDHTERYWARLRGAGDVKLNGVYLNAVPAEQASTVPREAVGISNGMADQRFSLRGAPVLTGQRVWVREDEAPTAAELSETTVDVRRNPVTQAQENWVLWHEQNSFSISQPNSRHYVLDRDSGEIRFGDGARGMIPSDGSAVAAVYKHGGGIVGNLAANMITKLSAKIAGIDAVYNPVPSSGGADSESAADVMGRGPMTIRHRGRGVTAQDIEWLVREAAGASVDRIKCLPGDDGQPFTLMLLPAEEGPRPLPSGALSTAVRAYLDRCLPAALPGGGFGIVGPKYIAIGVSAEIVPVDPLESSIVRERAIEKLRDFLHPRRGGLDGGGWEFGRNVYLSEICALLESVEGVEYALAGKVSIRPAAAQLELVLQTNDIHLTAEYPAGSLLSRRDNYGMPTEQWLLAEPIVTDTLPRTIRVTGVREGDALSVTSSFSYSETSGKFMGKADMSFPAGSLVKFTNTVSNDEVGNNVAGNAGHGNSGVGNTGHGNSGAGYKGVDNEGIGYEDDGYDGFTTVLKKPLPYQGELQLDALEEAPAPVKGFSSKTRVTVYHPDPLTVTDVWGLDKGGYAAVVRRVSEDMTFNGNMTLVCLRRQLYAYLSYTENTFGGRPEYDGDLVTLYFGGFRDISYSGKPGHYTLSLPSDRSGDIGLTVPSVRAVTDVAYLLDRELCTPGAVDVQAVEK